MPKQITCCVLLIVASEAACLQNLRADDDDVKPGQKKATVASKASVITPGASAAPATAKSDTKPPAAAGHSMHGEAFNEGPRQKAYLMNGMGDVHFPITTRDPLAQQFFDQGVGQLHGFWYFEAERSFRQAAALDGECAMAYWGMAMANANNDKRAKEFIEKAQRKKAGASRREAAWIDALAILSTGADTPKVRKKHIRALEALVHDYPNDVEAKAFLALQIWKNGSWMTEKKKQLPITSYQAVDALLDQVFAANPMHPAHHFRIHLWDLEKPARALVSASKCGQASPAIAHMWHMSGHIYSRLHRYADAAWQQEASARVDHAHMMRDRVLPDQIHNYAHNNEWLIRNLAHLGRVHDAIELAKNMVELPRHPKYNTADKSGGSAHYGLLRLGDVLVQYERWGDLLALADTQYFPAPADDKDQRLKRQRILGLASFGTGNAEEGRRRIAALEALLGERRAARYAAADDAEQKARRDNKSDEEVAKAMADALASYSDEMHDIELVLAELRGYDALAAGKHGDAKSHFENAMKNSAIRRDHLARAFSLAGDHERAVALAEKAVADGPGEVYPLAVLVDVLQRADKKPEAQARFTELRDLASEADLDNPAFERLRSIADELNLPPDWRRRPEPSLDVGQRPDLGSLGPLGWEPTPATSWSLPAADGKTLSLDRYRGKPLVLIFYLGSGCLHCVEQLRRFAPMADKYAEAGISIAAISSERLGLLTESLARLSPSEPIDFPLAADPELAVFKEYRAYDDFEEMALHGTYLIDGRGLVRWHDISYEPFLDPDFLLGEARRLLAQ